MRLHDLKPTPGSQKKKVRVGRGIAAGKGKTAGRGTKGTGARTGGGKGAFFEGGQLPLVRRLPFKRGFTNIFRIEYQEVNVRFLDARFNDGDVVNPQAMYEKGLIRDPLQPVVIMGKGDLTKKLHVHAHRFTKGASEKIVNAGGTKNEIAIKVTGALATVKKLPKDKLAKLQAE
ncbi:MAG: 50S ribosomal protein L15 [Phototrophicales bacterium]|jgi:large subunit ribosomal protein L15|nr:MAG: 50S ribosomal protein L15 [Phototrophicales bacterium]